MERRNLWGSANFLCPGRIQIRRQVSSRHPHWPSHARARSHYTVPLESGNFFRYVAEIRQVSNRCARRAWADAPGRCSGRHGQPYGQTGHRYRMAQTWKIGDRIQELHGRDLRIVKRLLRGINRTRGQPRGVERLQCVRGIPLRTPGGHSFQYGFAMIAAGVHRPDIDRFRSNALRRP